MMQDQPPEKNGRRGPLRLPALNIRAKIVIPYLILTLAVAIIGTYVVMKLVAGSLDERLTNQVLEAGRVVSDSLARREIAHVEAARVVAFTRGLAEALAARDQESVTRLAQPAAVGLGIECLIVVDADGRDLLQVLKQPDGSFQVVKSQFDTAGIWMVQALIRDNDPNAPPTRGLGEHPANQRYYYFTALPVGLNDQVVGAVIVGGSLDTLLPYFKTASVADVIIYQEGGRAVATTFTEATLDELAISPDLYASRIEDVQTTVGENIRVNNRWYRLARGPLRVGKDKVGVFAVVLPSNFIVSAGATSRNTYSLLFSIAVVCVILIGYWVSRRITHPLYRLVRTSQAVAEGDLEQRTQISSADEIGTLAATFDEMTGKLADRTRELVRLLHESKEAAGRMKAILSSIGDGVMLEDLKGNFIPMNAAAEHILAEMATGFLSSPLRELSVKDFIQASGDQPSPWFLDRRIFQVGKKVFSAHSAAVRTDDGERLGTVVVWRDVTAEIEADQLKDAFVAHTSHELRTPLTAIKGYSDLLLAGSLDKQQRSFLQTISRHTNNLIGMINGLLDFSEIEAGGRLGLQRRPVQLSTLVEEIAQEWRPQMDDKGLAFQVEIPSVLCQVNADVRRLRWAIINLVRNALQYTLEGQVTLRLSSRDGQVILDVIDTGVGLSPQDQQHLFNRFYRAQSTLDIDVRGLGLGLYVTKAIVEAHGGQIRVVSQEGIGSTFSMILPALQTDKGEQDAVGGK